MAEFTKERLVKALRESLDTGKLMPCDDGFDGWNARLTRGEDGDGWVMYNIVIWHSGHGLAYQRDVAIASDKRAVEIAADHAMCWQEHMLWPERPSESIKDWYQRLCPTDTEGELLEDVTFYEYLMRATRKRSFYVCGVGDSIVRQRLQAALDAAMGCNGNEIDEFVWG